MSILSDVGLHKYDLLPYLEEHKDFKILYESSYYDGPLDGMLLWEGKNIGSLCTEILNLGELM